MGKQLTKDIEFKIKNGVVVNVKLPIEYRLDLDYKTGKVELSLSVDDKILESIYYELYDIDDVSVKVIE